MGVDSEIVSPQGEIITSQSHADDISPTALPPRKKVEIFHRKRTMIFDLYSVLAGHLKLNISFQTHNNLMKEVLLLLPFAKREQIQKS